MANINLTRLTWESGKMFIQLAVNRLNAAITGNIDDTKTLMDNLSSILSRIEALENINVSKEVALEIEDSIIDWALSSNFYIALIEETELFDSNLPVHPKAKEIKIRITGEYTLTLPEYWLLTSGDYDGRVDNIITAYCADNVAEAQVDTITLTGTNGAAFISEAGELDKFIYFDSSLSETAAKFVADNAADYLAENIIITSNGADIIFTSLIPGRAFDSPEIIDTVGDLDGTVTNTTPNGEETAQVDTLTIDTGTDGAAEVSVVGGLTKELVFVDNYTTSAALFVTRYAAEYLTKGIVVTNDGADIIFTAAVAGVAFDHPVITNVASTLAGSVENTNVNVEPKVWFRIEQEQSIAD